MAINPPIDATSTPAWAALQKHYDELQAEGIDLKKWFAEDADRVKKLSFEAGDLHFDLSKNLVTDETLRLLVNLAKEVKLDERIKQQYTGVHINNTEDRAVLHTALRRPVEDEGKYIVDGQDTVKDVRETLERSTPSPRTCAPASGPASPAARSRLSSTSASAAPTSAPSWPTRR